MIKHDCHSEEEVVDCRIVDNTCFGSMKRIETRCRICGVYFVRYEFME